MAGPAGLRALRTLRLWNSAPAVGKLPSAGERVLARVPGAPCPAWGTPVRALQLCSAMCAGHNKWSKVKNIKGPKDEARARLFMKLAMMIRIAVKQGGPNPDMNSSLASAVEQCRSKNMPKASIEAAIKSAEKAKPATQYVVEARGPGGCSLLIEVLTDNSTRCQQDIKRVLNKNGGVLSEGASHNFKRSGVVVMPRQDVTLERALELAIEAGAEDVQEAEDEEGQPTLQFVCDLKELKKVRVSLEELGLQVSSAGMEYIPCVHSSLHQEQLDAASALIEALSDCPDVIQIWDDVQAVHS